MRKRCGAERPLRVERDQSLARIAAEHGFSNPGRFAKLFRRTYGASRSEKRRAESEG
jgi:AraC-like DNA-binding protein